MLLFLEHVFGVEAVDHDGQIITASRTGQATVEVEVIDVNDVRPKFQRSVYQGFMNKQLTALRNDLIVQVLYLYFFS